MSAADIAVTRAFELIDDNIYDDIHNRYEFKCQMETLLPRNIIEWVPYNKLYNIKFLTKGGFSEIYRARWFSGSYDKWNSKKQKLKRFGIEKVILKTLGNFENENQRWFEEAKSHLTISNKWEDSIVRCYEQCWDSDPLKRPDIITLWSEIKKINVSYQNTSNKLATNNFFRINRTNSLKSKELSYTSSELYTSKLHQFENLPEPRNATEEELEAFHSKPYDFEIPDNIEDFSK
ncbi:kinase-like domain-containing protein [Rhizophagus irregularis DAOM 181602=DAOM 197198]|nr:kinase-like domain-containing protein [Rhizophagus irregularis DAOM 181602=DAOM 197198]